MEAEPQSSPAPNPDWKVVNLALSGSGVLAIMQAGAVAVLRSSGYTFANIAGTSGGSIVGTMVAAGMSDHDIHDAISSIDYQTLQEPAHWYVKRLGVVGKLISEGFDVGVFKQNNLDKLVDAHLDALGAKTWGELRTKIAAGNATNLAVVAVNEEAYEVAVFPTFLENEVGITAADQPISFAVGCSAAVPNAFVPRVIAGKDGRQWHFIDGGFSDYLPFDVAQAMDPARKHRTIGIAITPPSDVVPYPKRAPWRFVTVNYNRGARGAGASNQALRAIGEVADNTIQCNSHGISALDFDLMPQQVQSLYLLGRHQAKQWVVQDLASGGRGRISPQHPPVGTGVPRTIT